MGAPKNDEAAAKGLGQLKDACTLPPPHSGHSCVRVSDLQPSDVKPSRGDSKAQSEASGQTIEQQIDDLIMRMKDCISHDENKHDQKWGERCITKVQFKQQMKDLIKDSERKARIDELERYQKDATGNPAHNWNYVKDRLQELKKGER